MIGGDLPLRKHISCCMTKMQKLRLLNMRRIPIPDVVYAKDFLIFRRLGE